LKEPTLDAKTRKKFLTDAEEMHAEVSEIYLEQIKQNEKLTEEQRIFLRRSLDDWDEIEFGRIEYLDKMNWPSVYYPLKWEYDTQS